MDGEGQADKFREDRRARDQVLITFRLWFSWASFTLRRR